MLTAGENNMKEIADLGIKLGPKLIPSLFICLLANFADAKNYELVPKDKDLELINESEGHLLTPTERLRIATQRANNLCDLSGGILFSMTFAPINVEREICLLDELSLPDPPWMTLLEGGIIIAGLSIIPWCFCGIFCPIDYQKLALIVANSTFGVTAVFLGGWVYGNLRWYQGKYGKIIDAKTLDPVENEKDTVCVNLETPGAEDKNVDAIACVQTSDPGLKKIEKNLENSENKSALPLDKQPKAEFVRVNSLVCTPKNLIYDWIHKKH